MGGFLRARYPCICRVKGFGFQGNLRQRSHRGHLRRQGRHHSIPHPPSGSRVVSWGRTSPSRCGEVLPRTSSPLHPERTLNTDAIWFELRCWRLLPGQPTTLTRTSKRKPTLPLMELSLELTGIGPTPYAMFFFLRGTGLPLLQETAPP